MEKKNLEKTYTVWKHVAWRSIASENVIACLEHRRVFWNFANLFRHNFLKTCLEDKNVVVLTPPKRDKRKDFFWKLLDFESTNFEWLFLESSIHGNFIIQFEPIQVATTINCNTIVRWHSRSEHAKAWQREKHLALNTRTIKSALVFDTRKELLADNKM